MSRNKTIWARLSPSEMRALLRMTKADGRPLSEWIREMVRREAERRGMWAAEPKEDTG